MKRKIFLVLFILVILYVYKTTEQNIFIPDKAIRLRVIPNSNNPEDINIKEKVKKYLETDIYTLTKDTTNIEDARTIISDYIPTIEENIGNIFTSNKYTLPYKVSISNTRKISR